MKCPNCRVPVNFARRECPRCGIVYQDHFEERARLEHEERKAHHKKAHAHNKKPHAKTIGWLAAPALAALVWFLTAPPAGLPLPSNAHNGPGFAYAAPAGWSVEAPSAPGSETVARLTSGTISAEIRVEPASVSGEARGNARALARGEFNGDEIKVDAVDEVEVDRLPAVRIMVSGGRVLLPSAAAGRKLNELGATAPGFESLPFAGELVAVAGDGCTYVLKIWSDRDTLRRRKAFVDGFVASFRVTKRPRTWGRWIRG